MPSMPKPPIAGRLAACVIAKPLAKATINPPSDENACV